MAANATSWSPIGERCRHRGSVDLWHGDHCVRRTILSLRLNLDVPVLGFVHDRSHDTREGERRTVVEVDVEEIGPSLRYATARVTRAGKTTTTIATAAATTSGGGEHGGGDPWTGAAAGGDGQPPF